MGDLEELIEEGTEAFRGILEKLFNGLGNPTHIILLARGNPTPCNPSSLQPRYQSSNGLVRYRAGEIP